MLGPLSHLLEPGSTHCPGRRLGRWKLDGCGFFAYEECCCIECCPFIVSVTSARTGLIRTVRSCSRNLILAEAVQSSSPSQLRKHGRPARLQKTAEASQSSFTSQVLWRCDRVGLNEWNHRHKQSSFCKQPRSTAFDTREFLNYGSSLLSDFRGRGPRVLVDLHDKLGLTGARIC